MQIAGEVQVDAVGRGERGQPASRPPALHPEDGAHRGLPQTGHAAVAEPAQRVGQADRDGRLPFPGRRNLYVTNAGNNTVSKVTPGGVVSTFATGFSEPWGLAFDSSGNLYVANHASTTVSKVTPGGAVSTFASGFSDPTALAFDSSGNLYVANLGTESVLEVTPAGVVSTFASGFSGPMGLAFH